MSDDDDDHPLLPWHLAGMVRLEDPYTSRLAAESIVPHLSELHEKVKAAFRAHGVLIDEDFDPTAKGLEEFRVGYAYSTVRKRRSELKKMGILVVVGQRCNSRGRWMDAHALRDECTYDLNSEGWVWMGHREE